MAVHRRVETISKKHGGYWEITFECVCYRLISVKGRGKLPTVICPACYRKWQIINTLVAEEGVVE